MPRVAKPSTSEWRPRRPVHTGGFNGRPVAMLETSNPAPLVGAQITLDGSGSVDPDGPSDIAVGTGTYTFTLTVKPGGSAAALGAGTDAAHKVLTVDVAGNYTVTLEVTDDGGANRSVVPATPLTSAEDSVLIVAAQPTDPGLAGENGAKKAVAFQSGDNLESSPGGSGAVTRTQTFEADLGRTVIRAAHGVGMGMGTAATYSGLTVTGGRVPVNIPNDSTVDITASTVSGYSVNHALWVVNNNGSSVQFSKYQGGAPAATGGGTVSFKYHRYYGGVRSVMTNKVNQWGNGIGASEDLGRADVEGCMILHLWAIQSFKINQGQSCPLAYRRTRRAQLIAGTLDDEVTGVFDLAHRTVTGITAIGANLFTKASHGFVSGASLRISSKTGGSGLSTSTTYRVKTISSSTFELYPESQYVRGVFSGSPVSRGSDVTTATMVARNFNFHVRYNESDIRYPGGYPDGKVVWRAGELFNQQDTAITGVSVTSNVFTKGTDIGFVNGLRVVVTNVGATGLTEGGTYYVTGVGTNSANSNFKLATSRANAFAGTAISCSNGTGLTITPQDESECKDAVEAFADLCHNYDVPIRFNHTSDGGAREIIKSYFGNGTNDNREVWRYGFPSTGHVDIYGMNMHPGRTGTLAGGLSALRHCKATSTELGVPWCVPEFGGFLVAKGGPRGMTASAATDTFTCTAAHGFSAGNKVCIGVDVGGTAAGNVRAEQWYYVIASGLTATQFKISTSAGGSALNITSDGTNLVAHGSSGIADNAGTWFKYTDVSASAATDKFTKTAHGLSNGQPVVFQALGALTGFSTWTQYFVVNKTTNDFQLAATSGGSAITFSTGGTVTMCDASHDIRTWLEIAYDFIAACPASGAGSCEFVCYWHSGEYTNDRVNSSNLSYFAPSTWAAIYKSPTGRMSGALA